MLAELVIGLSVTAVVASLSVLTEALRLVLLFLMCGIVAVQKWTFQTWTPHAPSAAMRCGWFQSPTGTCTSLRASTTYAQTACIWRGMST